MGRNLTSLPISASFQYLLQKSGSEVNDGLGADVDYLNISASYAYTASVADSATSASYATTATSASHALQADSATSATTATSASHAVNADTATSASYATTASFAENVTTPNLQQVTDEGASTTNAITLDGSATSQFTILKNGVNNVRFITTDALNQLTFNLSGSQAAKIDFNNGSGEIEASGDITLDPQSGKIITTDISASGYISASEFIGPLTGNATTATSASHAVNADSAISASFATSASYAPTGDPFPYTGSAEVSGSVIVDGLLQSGVGHTNSSTAGSNVLVGGDTHVISSGVQRSGMFAGWDSDITAGNASAIIAGGANALSSNYAVILGGEGNNVSSAYCGVLAGASNTISNADTSVIMGGYQNQVQGIRTTVLNGYQNIIQNTNVDGSTIIGGQQNTIPTGISQSAIIAGEGITADASDTVFVPNLHLTGSKGGTLTFADGTTQTTAAVGGAAFPYTGSAAILGTLDVDVSASVDGYTITSGSLSGSLVDNLGQQTIVTGSAVKHIVNLSQAEYDALTPDANTLYLISGSDAPFPYTGSAEITGSLIVTGSTDIDGVLSLPGIADVSASIAAAGGGAAFPYTGSAQITGSLAVTGSITGIGNAVFGPNTNSTTNNPGNGVFGGVNNDVTSTDPAGTNVIVGGTNNTLGGNQQNIIAGGTGNTTGNIRNFIFGGSGNTTSIGNSTIVGAWSSNTTGGSITTIVGGHSHTINGGNRNGIFAGTGNTNSHDYSVVIGGQSLSTSKADEVVVPSLTINGQALGNVGTISIASSTGSMDVSTANFFSLSLASGVDTHLDATNITAGKGQTITLFIRQDLSSAGTLSFSPDFLFEGGTPFTVSTGLGAKDVMTFVSDGSSLFATGLKDFS